MSEIYESPDHGHTIYVRKTGESERTLYSIDPEIEQGVAEDIQQLYWRKILKARINNPELHRLLEQVQIYYELSKK